MARMSLCPSCGSALLQPLRSRPGQDGEMAGLAGEAAVAKWNRHPHAPKPGFTPLELYQP